MEKEKCYTVYIHKFPNGKVYVGLTKQKPEDRWRYNGLGYKKQPVYEAILEYGWSNIEHEIVEDNLTYEEAQQLERNLVCLYDSIENGYNISEGGGLGGNPWVTFEYQGNIYTAEELAKMSSVNGLTYHDITTRVNHHGWSIEKALTQPKMKKDYLYEYDGKMFTAKELADIANIDGLTYKDILCRINKHGWTVERAITQPKNVKKQPKGIGDKIYEYQGKMYNSYELSKISKVKNLTPFDITDRINHHGWSVERAITQPKRKSPNKNKV